MRRRRRTHKRLPQAAGAFTVDLVFNSEAYLDALSEAVDMAGGRVANRFLYDEFQRCEEQPDFILLNLEPSISRYPDLLDAVCDGESTVVFNDADGLDRLSTNERARWSRHLAQKLNQERSLLPDARVVTESKPAVRVDSSEQEVWVFAASIGGPEALRAFLAELPELPNYGMILVQHIGVEFVETMVQQLDRGVATPVKLARDGDMFVPGTVYVVPPDSQIWITRQNRVRLEEPRSKSYSPCIDDVLRNTIERFGASTNAIIFSGMATDGVAGAEAVLEVGGEVWVQDPTTCVVSSIVDGALKTGGVRFIGDPKALAGRLARRSRSEDG